MSIVLAKRGRPTGSKIRQNIVEILYFLGEGYAYDIYRHYVAIFPKVTLRSIYYHLSKGTDMNEFIVKRIVNEQGDYSWGNNAEKIYYALGPMASPMIIGSVKEYFDDLKKEEKKNK